MERTDLKKYTVPRLVVFIGIAAIALPVLATVLTGNWAWLFPIIFSILLVLVVSALVAILGLMTGDLELWYDKDR